MSVDSRLQRDAVQPDGGLYADQRAVTDDAVDEESVIALKRSDSSREPGIEEVWLVAGQYAVGNTAEAGSEPDHARAASPLGK